MKPSPKLVAVGKWLMRKGKLRILIADDEAAYFTPKMLDAARNAGYHGIKRISQVDQTELTKLLKDPPHIVILDVKGVCPPEIAKDGIELAKMLVRETPSMVVVTSAHHFHLRATLTKIDHIIESRKLTAVDFVEELAVIVDKYMDRKSRFYQNLAMKAGMALARGAMQSAA